MHKKRGSSSSVPGNIPSSERQSTHSNLTHPTGIVVEERRRIRVRTAKRHKDRLKDEQIRLTVQAHENEEKLSCLEKTVKELRKELSAPKKVSNNNREFQNEYSEKRPEWFGEPF